MNAVRLKIRIIGRMGFTLTEVLVAIGMIGLLAAILLPAVQSSREAARGTECRNRQRQIGLALQNFESRYGQFPMEGGPWLTVPPSSQKVPGQYSVHVQLLNDLEQSPLAAQIDLTRPHHGAWNLEAESAWLHCPSDPGHNSGTSFRVCTGTWPRKYGSSGDGRGMFSTLNKTTLRDVLDGASQTIALSERSRSDDSPEAFDAIVDVIGSGAASLFSSGNPSPDEMYGVCRTLGSVPALGYSGQVGWYWYRTNSLQTHYNHVATPNAKVTDCTLGSLITSTGIGMANHTLDAIQMTARSYHPGGVHCLLGDGAVRLVNDSIDLDVWRALATISDGEIANSY